LSDTIPHAVIIRNGGAPSSTRSTCPEVFCRCRVWCSNTPRYRPLFFCRLAHTISAVSACDATVPKS
jgi:hypothetical protein